MKIDLGRDVNVEHSNEKATEYISNYILKNGKEFYVVLVVK